MQEQKGPVSEMGHQKWTTESSFVPRSQPVWAQQGNGGRFSKVSMKPKEYPPTLPCFVRTEENMGSHKPWILQRYCTDDGRLIIRKEKSRHLEYFKVHRSNRRLTLQLVPLDVDHYEAGLEEKRKDNVETHHCEGDEDDNPAGNEAAVVSSGAGGGGQFCCGVGSVFGTVPLPHSRPVHI